MPPKKWHRNLAAYKASQRNHTADRKPPPKAPAAFRMTKLICELKTNNVSYTREQLLDAFSDLLEYITKLEERVRKQ